MTKAEQPTITQSDELTTLEKMLESRRRQLTSCERMLELLRPEWDKFEAKTGHDLYVARDYADHTSAARTHRKEISALEYAIAASRTTSLAAQDGLVEALEDGLAALLSAKAFIIKTSGTRNPAREAAIKKLEAALTAIKGDKS